MMGASHVRRPKQLWTHFYTRLSLSLSTETPQCEQPWKTLDMLEMKHDVEYQ